jgi:hypothetical protein
MLLDADAEVCLFVRDARTGRVVFNAEAIRALGLSPVELRQRGYALGGQVDSAPASETTAGEP